MNQCACPVPDPQPIDGDGMLTECGICGLWYCAILPNEPQLAEFQARAEVMRDA